MTTPTGSPRVLTAEEVDEMIRLNDAYVDLGPATLGRLLSSHKAVLQRLAALQAMRPEIETIAREFIAYYTSHGGCGNCGGVPHSSTCFVGRFIEALAHPAPTQPGA